MASACSEFKQSEQFARRLLSTRQGTTVTVHEREEYHVLAGEGCGSPVVQTQECAERVLLHSLQNPSFVHAFREGQL